MSRKNVGHPNYCKEDVREGVKNIHISSPQGKFMPTIFVAISELERESFKQRQAEGIAVAKEKGEVTFGRPKVNYPDSITLTANGGRKNYSCFCYAFTWDEGKHFLSYSEGNRKKLIQYDNKVCFGNRCMW